MKKTKLPNNCEMIEYSDGSRHWFQNEEYHRIDGPAIEFSNGIKQWWINGKNLSQEEFDERTKWQEENNNSMNIPQFRFFANKNNPMFFIAEDSISLNSLLENDDAILILRRQEKFVEFMNICIQQFCKDHKRYEAARIEDFKKQMKSVGYWHGIIWNTMVRNNHLMKWFEIEKDAKEFLSSQDLDQLKIIFLQEKAQWEAKNKNLSEGK